MRDIDMITKLKNSFQEKSFFDDELHKKAQKDFVYLCAAAGYNTSYRNKRVVLLGAGRTTEIGEFLVVGKTEKMSAVEFPAEVDIENDKHFVAVIVYENDTVKDTFVFNATGFKKAGIFSMLKNNKKAGMLAVKIKNANSNKLKQYSFGYVLKKIMADK